MGMATSAAQVYWIFSTQTYDQRVIFAPSSKRSIKLSHKIHAVTWFGIILQDICKKPIFVLGKVALGSNIIFFMVRAVSVFLPSRKCISQESELFP